MKIENKEYPVREDEIVNLISCPPKTKSVHKSKEDYKPSLEFASSNSKHPQLTTKIATKQNHYANNPYNR